MLEIITEAETPLVVVADVPMVVAVLGRRVGVLGFLALALGPLPDSVIVVPPSASMSAGTPPHAMCHVLADMVDLRSALRAIRGML